MAEEVDPEEQAKARKALADKAKALLPKLEKEAREAVEVPTADSWKSEYKKKPAWWDRYVEQERIARERAKQGQGDYDYADDDAGNDGEDYYDDEFYNVNLPKD